MQHEDSTTNSKIQKAKLGGGFAYLSEEHFVENEWQKLENQSTEQKPSLCCLCEIRDTQRE